MKVRITKTLVALPEQLSAGMRIKSGRGTFGIVMKPRKKNSSGQQLYRLKYKYKNHVIRGSRLFTRDDLVDAGCRLCV